MLTPMDSPAIFFPYSITWKCEETIRLNPKRAKSKRTVVIRQSPPFVSHWIADNIAKPNAPDEDEPAVVIWDHNILNGEGQEGQEGVFTIDAGEVAFVFPAAIEESGDSLGQLLTVLRFRDEAVLGAIDTFAAEQGVGGEAAEDLENVILYEASQRIHLVVGLLYFEEPAIVSVQLD